MQKFSILFSLFPLLLFISGCNDQTPTITDVSSDNSSVSLAKVSYPLTDSYIVEFNSSVADLKTEVESVGGILDFAYTEIGYAQVSKLSASSSKILLKKNGIKSVTQDYLVPWVKPDLDFVQEANLGADETYFIYQWNMKAINAPEAWNLGFTGRGVRVAVIDGGISANHIDLVSNIDATASKSFVTGFEWYDDATTFRHATHVAGIIAAADNARGTIGVAPNATIIALKALHNGSGSFGAIISAIIYAAKDANADIINMSLGAVFPRNSLDAAKLNQALGAAINYAYQKGVVVIVSAGNDAIDFDHAGMYVHMPSEAQHVINISATAPTNFYGGGNDFDTPASYTNYGQSFIDFTAPGGDFDYPGSSYVYDMILSPGAGTGSYFFAAGTSMAAPHVAGVCALIIEASGYSLTPAEVEAKLRIGADDLGKPGNDDFYGLGRVNAFKSVSM